MIRSSALFLTLLMVVTMTSHATAGESALDEDIALFPLMVKGRWGYIDREGEIVIDPEFWDVGGFSEGLAAVAVLDENGDERWGFIDRTGEFVIEPRYNEYARFSEGLAAVATDPPDGKQMLYAWSSVYNYIDTTGEVVIEGDFAYAGMFSEDLATVYPEDGRGGVMLILDKHGNTVFEKEKRMMQSYHEGLAGCWLEGGMGFLDREGNVAIDSNWYRVHGFSEGVSVVLNRYRDGDDTSYVYLLIDREGNELFQFPQIGFDDDTTERPGRCHEGLISTPLDGKRGFLNTDGEWAIEPLYDSVSNFENGRAVALTGLSGAVIDRDGVDLAKFEIDAVPGADLSVWLTDGLAKVWIGESSGYIDRDGNRLYSCPGDVAWLPLGEGLTHLPDREGVYHLNGEKAFDWSGEDLANFSDGLAEFNDSETELFGFVDKQGKVVIPPRYRITGGFSEGLGTVSVDGILWGVIDKQGEWAIEPAFESVNRFENGLAPIEIAGKWGQIDKSGEIVIEPRYDSPFSFSEGLAAVKKDGKYGYISRKGIELIGFQFDAALEFTDGLAAVMQDGKWGFIDRLGRFRIEPEYLFAQSFSDGLAAVALPREGSEGPEFSFEDVLMAPTLFPQYWRFDLEKRPEFFFIDKTGRVVNSEGEYMVAGSFSEGRAKVVRELGDSPYYGFDFIDTEGNLVTDYYMEQVWTHKDGETWVVFPGTSVYVDLEGNVVWPPTN